MFFPHHRVSLQRKRGGKSLTVVYPEVRAEVFNADFFSLSIFLCLCRHWNIYALHSIKGEAPVSLFDVYFVVVFLAIDRNQKEQPRTTCSFQ